MCPVRQFNVQLYVEKVFIAQKTSEDRGGKVRKAGKRHKAVGKAYWKRNWGEGEVESRTKGRTRWRRQGNNRADRKEGGEKRYG